MDKADLLEEVNTEISVYLGMMYHLIEVFKGHEDFADELSEFIMCSRALSSIHSQTVTLDPPLPVYLFNVVAGLRDKSAKGYPVKKVCSPMPQLSTSLTPDQAAVGSLEDPFELLRRRSGD